MLRLTVILAVALLPFSAAVAGPPPSIVFDVPPPERPPDFRGAMLAIDGDTLLHRETGTRLRLFGLDAPEMTAPGGLAARSALDDLLGLAGGSLFCWERDRDRYKRPVVRCSTRDDAYFDPAINLLEHGYAATHRVYLAGDPVEPYYRLAECRGRAARRGLWRQQAASGWTLDAAERFEERVEERPATMPWGDWLRIRAEIRAALKEAPAGCADLLLAWQLRVHHLDGLPEAAARTTEADHAD